MTRDKVFLNPDLNLALLSNYLDISQKSCSHLLNKGMNANFNQYINSFRIQAFKEKIVEEKHKTHTLTGLAYESGFDSKSTFNRVFKASCGVTPSDYVRSTRKEV